MFSTLCAPLLTPCFSLLFCCLTHALTHSPSLTGTHITAGVPDYVFNTPQCGGWRPHDMEFSTRRFSEQW